jgi:putative ABC transport system permease protein
MRRIRFVLRSLSKAPLLSLVVVSSLGLGIGVNTAIFSLLHELVLRSLPIPHPERLVLITSPGEFKHGRTSDNESGGMDFIFNWRTFRELEKHTEAAEVVGFRRLESNIGFARQTVSGPMMLVSGDYFRVLGVKPLLGRLIERQDDVPGAGNPVAVLGFRYWRETLGEQASVLNQIVIVNGQPFTIVGITPPNFTGTTVGSGPPHVFIPMSSKPRVTEGWNGTDKLADYWIYLMARLKPGITLQQAEAALNVPYRGIVEEMSGAIHETVEQSPRFREQRLSLKEGSRGNNDSREQYRHALLIIILATGLVLLIAIANAANLLLARAVERRRELAIRAAMGAGRGTLMGEFLTEALLLSVTGGVAGLAIAAGTLKLLAAWWGDAAEASIEVGLNLPVLLFSLGLSLATGLLFGLYPAWEASRTSVATRLNEESLSSSSSRDSARLRTALVCAQLTISIVLLVPTGLFLKSLVNLLHVDLGLRIANVVGFRITPSANGYSPAQRRALFERVEAELAAIPGVRSAAASSVPLIGDSNWGTSFSMEGLVPGTRRPNSKFNDVGPRFFGKAGIPLIAGREILDTDTAAAPKVVVVNETFVKEFFGGRNPVGHRLGFGKDGALDTEIVGIVKDSHYASVRQEPPPVFFRPWRQDGDVPAMSFYLRSELDPRQIVPQIRSVMRAIDSDVPLQDMRTMQEQIHVNVRSDELMLRLAMAFAALATILAMLGLYGVMAYGVARRRREIGIRMALGAGPARIQSMVMGQLIWILGFGLGIGIPAALACTRLIESRLYGVKGSDVTVIATAALVLSLTAVVAAYWPARRAARVNPLDALRYE